MILPTATDMIWTLIRPASEGEGEIDNGRTACGGEQGKLLTTNEGNGSIPMGMEEREAGSGDAGSGGGSEKRLGKRACRIVFPRRPGLHG